MLENSELSVLSVLSVLKQVFTLRLYSVLYALKRAPVTDLHQKIPFL